MQAQINEAIELAKKAIKTMPHIEHKADENDCYCLINQVLTKLRSIKEPEHRWIPVSERLPELPSGPPNASSETVWLIFEGTPQMGYYTNYNGWNVYGICFQKRLNQKDITHWMPIILPGQAENKKLVEGQQAKQ